MVPPLCGDEGACAAVRATLHDPEATSIEEIIAELDTTKTPERAGRAMDHEAEDSFERLRVAGYL